MMTASHGSAGATADPDMIRLARIVMAYVPDATPAFIRENCDPPLAAPLADAMEALMADAAPAENRHVWGPVGDELEARGAS
jgi:hypothetical protein